MSNTNENKMGVMPENKLLISMSLPIMISMIVQALYNIVDSVFVSRVSQDALTAVSLAFPIQTLMIAVSVGTCVGISALISMFLGRKEFDSANNTAKNGIFLCILSSVVFMIFGAFFAERFFAVQITDPKDIEIIRHGKAYLSICCIFCLPSFGQVLFERLLSSTGKTIYTMCSQGVGAIVNIILDPIFIFGVKTLGIPAMGAGGAAVATVAGQLVACILALTLNIKFNHEISLNMKGFRPSLKIIKRIYAIGVPSIVMQSIGSIMTFGFNKILLGFESTAATVFGVYFKLNSFAFMPLMGLNNGMVPIIAYNYGAGHKNRIIKTIKLSCTYGIIIMICCCLAFQLIPEQLLSIFDADANMIAIGVPALRIIGTSFLFAGYCIVISSVFQALGSAHYSMIVSIARQLVVLLPVAYLLSRTGKLEMVWYSYPIAEIASLIISTIFFIKIYKNTIKNL